MATMSYNELLNEAKKMERMFSGALITHCCLVCMVINSKHIVMVLLHFSSPIIMSLIAMDIITTSDEYNRVMRTLQEV